jgi:hypothetical protein
MKKTRLLFYLEPSCQSGAPFFHLNWAIQLNEIFNSFSTMGEAEGLFLLPSHLVYELKDKLHPKLKVIEVTQNELFQNFEQTTNLARHYYGFSWEPEFTEKYSRHLRKLCGGFEPDYCFTFNLPAPFLKQSFPGKLVLHQETGMFSRPPFPLTNFIDPFGQYDSTYLNRYKNELLNGSLTHVEQAELDRLKKIIVDDVIVPKNPFKEVDLFEGRQFKHKILFGLQFFNFNDFLGDLGVESQLDLLIQLLAAVGPKTAVVTTQHQEYRVLSYDVIQWLKKEFPNFIFRQDFDNWYSVSQYLMHNVDGVFTASSSIGLQALFSGKPFFALGSSGIAQLAHTHHLHEIVPALEKNQFESRDFALHHLLSHYYLPESVLKCPKRLVSWLSQIKSRYDQGKLGFGLAGKIDSPFEGGIFEELESLCRTRGIPSHIPNSSMIASLKNDPKFYAAYNKFEEQRIAFEASIKDREMLAQDVENLREELNRIYSSKSWKVLKFLKSVYAKVTTLSKSNQF